MKDVVDLEETIQAVYACNEAGGYYDLVNDVMVRLDLVEDQLEGSPETSSFFWLVSIEGLTNLVDLEDHLFDYSNYEQLSDDHPRQVLEDQGVFLRRNLQECACALPSREEFVSALSPSISATEHIDEVLSVVETEQKGCALEITTFTSSVAIEMVGNVDLATPENLGYLAKSVISTFNNLNGFDNCDLKFRTLATANTFVDPLSIRLGQGGMRRLEDGGSNSYSPSNDNGTEFPTDGTTFSPTQATTTRGPDLFTVLLELQGLCRNCTDEDGLFDQTDDGIKLQEARENVTKKIKIYQDSCICPAGAKKGSFRKREQILRDDAFDFYIWSCGDDVQGSMGWRHRAKGIVK